MNNRCFQGQQVHHEVQERFEQMLEQVKIDLNRYDSPLSDFKPMHEPV